MVVDAARAEDRVVGPHGRRAEPEVPVEAGLHRPRRAGRTTCSGRPRPRSRSESVPSRPLRMISAAWRKSPKTFDRCWLPVWKTRLYFRAASMHRLPSASVSVSGFSQ